MQSRAGTLLFFVVVERNIWRKKPAAIAAMVEQGEVGVAAITVLAKCGCSDSGFGQK